MHEPHVRNVYVQKFVSNVIELYWILLMWPELNGMYFAKKK